MEALTLKIVTPEGEKAHCTCDGIRLRIPDDQNERNGGWVGIHPGHTPALMALTQGEVLVYRDGQEVERILIQGGFASVQENVVTVITS